MMTEFRINALSDQDWLNCCKAEYNACRKPTRYYPSRYLNCKQSDIHCSQRSNVCTHHIASDSRPCTLQGWATSGQYPQAQNSSVAILTDQEKKHILPQEQ
jgi:hypothetical protein